MSQWELEKLRLPRPVGRDGDQRSRRIAQTCVSNNIVSTVWIDSSTHRIIHNVYIESNNMDVSDRVG